MIFYQFKDLLMIFDLIDDLIVNYFLLFQLFF